MKVRRSELCDQICLTIGISRRRKGRSDLSKRELERLISYITILKSQRGIPVRSR